MEFYPTLPTDATPAPGGDDGRTPAGMVAVRPADLIRPGRGGVSALVARRAAAGPVIPGEPLAFCHQVTVAPAVVRRSGEVQAGGWLPDHVTLGVLEAHLPPRGDRGADRGLRLRGAAAPATSGRAGTCCPYTGHLRDRR